MRVSKWFMQSKAVDRVINSDRKFWEGKKAAIMIRQEGTMFRAAVDTDGAQRSTKSRDMKDVPKTKPSHR